MSTHDENDNSGKPRRRPRYKGTHPKAFKEKYKEQHPDKYTDHTAKVIARGHTPAGTHRPICVDEIMAFLQPQPGQTGLDCTLGYGGHTTELLKRITPGGHLFATDVDPLELPKTTARLRAAGFGEDVLTTLPFNFEQIDEVVAISGPLQFVLADLGISSMQIDNPDRGFSFRVDGPLDLRLNPWRGKPASALLKTISREELEEILLENADEPHHAVIAHALTHRRHKTEPITTTQQLRKLIAEALHFLPPAHQETDIKKACQRVFQALRIEVNNEFGVLDNFLEKLPGALQPGGRVAILTFHSGEDRRVKKSFQRFFREGVYAEIAAEPVRPSAAECAGNPRAKPAKLRWAVLG
ncbi:MAG: 16S rRNA (cytosine(1402)-N(4))-methyltransferase RsmH [Bacteroidia bacterium]|nr:16S rRNA (cytosine(1402)-N(4))-methyltransferase RsmH [Bacteroidia bacterium]